MNVINGKLSSKVQFVLTNDLPIITFIRLSKNASLCAVVGYKVFEDNIMPVVHIYSMETYKLVHCFTSLPQKSNLMSLAFGKRSKYLALLFDDFNLLVFDLSVKSIIGDDCSCSQKEKETMAKNREGIFSSMLKKVKVRN